MRSSDSPARRRSATATGDGGGLVTAVLHPIEGGDQVASFFASRANPEKLRPWTAG